MRLDFPREDIPTHLVEPHYKFLMDAHMHYDKMRTEREFSYIKYAGFFALASLAFMMMQDKGLVSDYLIGVIFTGFGVLLASAMGMIFISAGIDWKLARCANEGSELEEKYQSIVNFSYFQAVNSVRVSRYRAALFFRLFPFVFVGIFTVLAGVGLSMRISTNLATFVGIASSTALIVATFFLARTTKRRQLLSELE